MRMVFSTMLVLAIVLSSLAVGSEVALGQDLEGKFRKEAVELWERLEAVPLQLQGSMVKTTHLTLKGRRPFPPGGGPPSKLQTDFLINGSSAWVKTLSFWEDKPEKYDERVRGKNANYSFKLKRDSASDPFGVMEITNPALGGERATEQERFFMHTDLGSYLRAGFSIDDMALSRLVRKPTFVVKEVSSIQEKEKTLVLVQCEFVKDDDLNPKGRHEVRKASLLVDPENSWAIQKWELTVMWYGGERLACQIEYGENENFPVPKRIVQTRRALDGSGERVDTTEFIQLTRRAASEQEFGLSAFGLSEPAAPLGIREPSKRWLWILLVLVGIILLTLAGGVVRYAARKRLGRRVISTPSSPSP